MLPPEGSDSECSMVSGKPVWISLAKHAKLAGALEWSPGFLFRQGG